MGKIVLYQVPLSPSTRTVIMVAKVIGVELEEKFVDLFSFEHRKPEFLKINPQHSVPTLVDNDHIVWNSSAIAIYLLEKYAENHPLYPKDPTVRSVINQRLFFEASVLFPAMVSCGTDTFFNGKFETSEKQLNDLANAYELFNVLFTNNNFLVGNSITLADYVCVTTVGQMEVFLKINDTQYPNIRPWLRRVQRLIPNHNELDQSKIETYREKVAEVRALNLAKQKAAKLV